MKDERHFQYAGQAVIKGVTKSIDRCSRGAPGSMIQPVTTREPDEKQMETAICALKEVIESYTGEETEVIEDQSISSLPNS